MADFTDDATNVETQFTKVAIENQLLRSQQTPEKESASHCVECESLIPEGRRNAIKGCQFCAPCQSLAEQGKL